MSLKIPDIILVNTVNTCLTVLRDDYNNHITAGTPGSSMLYLLYGNLALGNYTLYHNIVKTIITTPENPKHIKAQLSYDHNVQSSAPVIWITLPSENNKNNTLGIGEGNQDELLIAGATDQYRPQLNYRWNTTYQIVIGSENRNEAMALYHLIKAMIIACIGHLSVEGIENLKIGGQDIRLNTIFPDKLFTKAITLNFEYEQVIPTILVKDLIRTIRVYWKPEGAVTSQGPIEISVEDDVSSSGSGS